ncbi:MAG TPA: glycerate dehydrogenase [Candidatus Marinimicrobia bacterium]|nr:glycerate dehydrogenase [Candidatus Neomarinimicrobiota bacterium]
MNIVVLDGYCVNPGDLSWTELEKLGNCKIFDRTEIDQVVERAIDADILLTNKIEITEETLNQLSKLKYIGIMATGFNIVDTETAANRGIPVTNVPAYSTLSVAQAAFAHILNLTHHVGEHSASVRNGEWSKSPYFSYWHFPLMELQDLTLGIIGMGRIGRTLAEIANKFGMKVIYHDIRETSGLPAEFRRVEIEMLFRESDVVSLHCPLTPETDQIVNSEKLSWMKSSAFLINTSRGQLIDESALAEALNRGEIAGAGLDVLSSEPPPQDNPLLSAKNCYITPHFAWATKAARIRLLQTSIDNIRAFLQNSPINVVNNVSANFAKAIK